MFVLFPSISFSRSPAAGREGLGGRGVGGAKGRRSRCSETTWSRVEMADGGERGSVQGAGPNRSRRGRAGAWLRLRRGGGGRGFIAITFQCRMKAPPASVGEEKERERTGIEVDEQQGSMTFTQLAARERVHNVCVVVVGGRGAGGGLSVSVLSGRVRGTVRAGASLTFSRSLSFTCVREASKRQLPVN